MLMGLVMALVMALIAAIAITVAVAITVIDCFLRQKFQAFRAFFSAQGQLLTFCISSGRLLRLALYLQK